MHYSSALTAQLSSLTSTFADPGTDLQTTVNVLAEEMSMVVPSFLGLTMTQSFDGFDVTMTAIDAGRSGSVRSSLELPLDLRPDGDPHCAVVFYAGESGAFTEMAADIQRVNGPDLRIVLDGLLPDPLPTSGVTGLAELSAVNRAIGVLITRGYFPAEAYAELRRRVIDGRDSVPDAARRVLLSTNAPRPCETVPIQRTPGAGRRVSRPVHR